MGTFVGDEPGNIEKRRADRISANLSVTFRELDDTEADRLNDLKGGITDLPVAVPTAAHGGEASVQPGAGHTENISQGGISLTGDLELLGDRRLERGKKLLVEFLLPGEKVPVSAVAVVVWSIQGKGEHSKFTAGVMFTGVNQNDLDKIQHYVEEQARS